ncbi:MAG TPA: hypothetical protein VI731_01150, partial [Bacteroidia bacterium]|nr:hypothetical protein [Bacteroidia bacterium]
GRIGGSWFSSGAGLAVAAGLAFLQFPLMYSQLARPYAPGLFFTMGCAWFWSQWIFGDHPRRKDLLYFILFATGAVYSHYFSLLMAGLIGILGLFFLRGKPWKNYLVACFLILLLFLPYTGIFIYQLTAGGVGGPGGWLGKPTPAFFGSHLWFIFDASRIILYGSMLLAFACLVFFFRRPGKFHALCLLLWAIPLLTGYFYSIKFNPVLQHSVLLFSFPFLLLFLFSWIPAIEKFRFAPLLPLGYAFALAAFVLVYRPYRLTNHFGRLKEIAAIAIETEKNYGKTNVACAFSVDYPFYVGYYFDRLNYQPSQVLSTVNNGWDELAPFRKLVENAKGDYFVYGWSTRFSPLEATEIIREKYPYLLEQKYWFNSAVFVFGKNIPARKAALPQPLLFASLNNYGSPASLFTTQFVSKNALQWSVPCKPWTDDFAWKPSMEKNELLGSVCRFSSEARIPVRDVVQHPDHEIYLASRVKFADKAGKIRLVIEFERDGKQLYYNSIDSKTQVDAEKFNTWQMVYFGIRLPADLRSSDMLHVYIYTPDGKPALVDFIHLRSTPGHTGLYGVRVPFI